jgi:hypothetical protein
MDDESVNQLLAEDASTFTSTFTSVNQLSAEDASTFTSTSAFVELASALEEAVPVNPSDVQAQATFVTRDISTRFRLQEAKFIPSDAEVIPFLGVIQRDNYEQFRELLLKSVESRYTALNSDHDERRRQARTSFNVAYNLLIVGIVLIFIGAIIVLLRGLTAAIYISLVGCVSEAISALLLRFNKDSNDRLDETTKSSNILLMLELSMRFIDQITDEEERNKALRELARDIRTR